MKKLLIILSLVTTMCLSVNAQNSSDGFFSTSTPSTSYRDGSATEGGFFPVAPTQNTFSDQSAAPVGSGLLLLAGMGLAYAMRRKQS